MDGLDDSPNCGGFTTELSWCSQAGAEYLILVHGFASATGDFTLSLSEDGVPCNANVLCLPAGACCFSDGSCIVTTGADCADQGGDYQGDGTDCGQFSYVDETCANDFEDISGTGIVAPTASSVDDGGDVVPIGFTFSFFGDAHGTIGISSNGYLTFGTTLGDFTNDSIPTADEPNDIICPYWDDWSPNQAGTVYYQTLGSAPDRRFIVQWDGVEAFGGNVGELATFQAVLYEGSNCIEFRYGDLLFFESPTVGVENSDGSEGFPGGFGPVPSPGDCISLCPVTSGNPCEDTGCFDVLDIETHCHPDGETFTVVVTGINNCTGAEMTVVSTASGGVPGEELCMTITINDEDGGFCCSELVCVTIPDCSEPANACDLDGDNVIGTSDLLILLGQWGSDPLGPPDYDADGEVGTNDLLTLLAGWGPCP